MARVFSYLFYAYFFISSYFFLSIGQIVCWVTAPFDPLRKIVAYYISWWAYHYVQIVPTWKCHIEGVENIDANKNYVLVANHQSFADINVLYGLYRPYKWVSKAEVFKIPILGWNLRLNECVAVKRGDRRSIMEMMATCQDWLKRGATLMIFPEGTRSEDGIMREFKDGAFRLAIDSNVPIVPIVLDGTKNIVTKGSDIMNFHADIRVKVLTPVYGSDFDNDSVKLKNHVHSLMANTLAELRGEICQASALPIS
jgi:1-acyl-sn-glycerol-3-phosphate acyltransferase